MKVDSRKNLCVLVLLLPLLMAMSGKPKPADAVKMSLPETEAKKPIVTIASAPEKFAELVSGIDKIDSVPEGSRRNFAEGYAFMRRGKWQAAADRFAKAAAGLSEIGDYTLFYRAKAANRLSRYKDAAGFLNELAEKYPKSAWNRDADYELARSLVGLGHYVEGAKRIAKFKKVAKGNELFDADLLELNLLLKSGDDAGAIEKGKLLAVNASCEEELAELEPSLSEIKKKFKIDIGSWLSTPQNQYLLAKSFSEHSEWQQAADRLEKILAGKRISGDLEANVKWLLARACRWTHRYDRSVELMLDLKKDALGKSFSGALPVMLATVYAKMNEYEKAIDVRTGILRKYPAGSRAGASVAYQIAYLYLDEGKYEESARAWRNVLSMGLKQKQKALAKWNLAWCHYMLGAYDDAVEIMDNLLRHDAKQASIEDRVKYWKARIFYKTGKKSIADSIWKDIASNNPNGYYAYLSRRRLAGDIRGTDDFIEYKEKKTKISSLTPKTPLAATYLSRARLFDEMGLHEEVVRELELAVRGSFRDFEDYVMSLSSRNYGHNLSLRLAQGKYKGEIKGDPSSGPLAGFVWKQLFPEAYSPIVEFVSKVGGVDRFLIWSIMKNESTFRPGVKSPVGAVGLMQLMPTTAEKMMMKISGKGVDRRRLGEPSVNITLGAAYLAKLFSLMPGNAVGVIASYNAGEEAVLRWLANGHLNDIEEWIEEIPYGETNLYVKKVLATYWNYCKLYGS